MVRCIRVTTHAGVQMLSSKVHLLFFPSGGGTSAAVFKSPNLAIVPPTKQREEVRV